MKINVGGSKGWKKYPKEVQDAWRVLDLNPSADVVHDLNSDKQIPLCDGVVSCYYASHVLEHVRMEKQRWVFSELRRTMCDGGRLRVVVPDLKLATAMYLNDPRSLNDAAFPTVHPTAPETALGRYLCWLYTPNRETSSGHCMGYDYETLWWYAREAGFRFIEKMEYGRCHPSFDGLDFPRYKGWCIFAELTK